MAETTTTYEVFKRKADSEGNFYLHTIMDAPMAFSNDEPAIFDNEDEARACAARLEPEYETAIKVVETTVRTVEWL